MLTFQTRRQGGAIILAISGSVQAPENQAFARELERLCAAPPARLILDLAGLEYLNSTGLAELAKTFQQFRSQGRELCAAAPRPGVLKVLRYAGLADLMGVFPDVPAALAGARTPPGQGPAQP